MSVAIRRLREALALSVSLMEVKNGKRYAYDHCRLCGGTWYGEREGRDNPEKPRHTRTCPVPGWKRTIQRTARLSEDTEKA